MSSNITLFIDSSSQLLVVVEKWNKLNVYVYTVGQRNLNEISQETLRISYENQNVIGV